MLVKVATGNGSRLIYFQVFGDPSEMMTSSNGNLFPRYLPFVRGIHRSPVNSPHKAQWRVALMFSLICWINGWVNNRDAGDLRRHHAHYDVTVMYSLRGRRSISVKTYFRDFFHFLCQFPIFMFHRIKSISDKTRDTLKNSIVHKHNVTPRHTPKIKTMIM